MQEVQNKAQALRYGDSLKRTINFYQCRKYRRGFKFPYIYEKITLRSLILQRITHSLFLIFVSEWRCQRRIGYERSTSLAKRLHRKRRRCVYTRRWNPDKPP